MPDVIWLIVILPQQPHSKQSQYWGVHIKRTCRREAKKHLHERRSTLQVVRAWFV